MQQRALCVRFKHTHFFPRHEDVLYLLSEIENVKYIFILHIVDKVQGDAKIHSNSTSYKIHLHENSRKRHTRIQIEAQ